MHNPFMHPGGHGHGRQLLNNVTENWTFNYIIIAFTVTFGAVLFGVAALLWWCLRSKKTNRVQPDSGVRVGEGGRGSM